MKPALAIRPFTAADTPRLIAVLESVFTEYGMRFDPDGYDKDCRTVETRYAPPDAVFYAAELDGRTVGFAGADLPRPRTAELHRVYIDPAARGHGLGGQLVSRIETWARERGALAVELWSDVRFAHAHALYARLGYALMGQRVLGDPDRSVEFGFRRVLERPVEPVGHSLGNAVRRPLASLDETRHHWASMVAAAILDSRSLVSAGRMSGGGHELPSPRELFPGAKTNTGEVSVLQLPTPEGPAIVGFASGDRVRVHPLFASKLG